MLFYFYFIHLRLHFFLTFNYITKFKYFELFLFIVLLSGIILNIYNAWISETFPPMNYASLLVILVVLHYVYNRWISLLYIVLIVIVIFILVFIKNSLNLNWDIFQLRLQYFYDFVFASLILWFILEVYEHFREELELKLKQINNSREKDLELAGEIQKQFYPAIPEDPFFYIDYLIIPYDKVSGDYLDIIKKNDYYWIIIGDVTGHGLQSSMLTMQINTLLNYLIIEKDYDDIQEIFWELNNHYFKILNKLDIKNYASLTLAKIFPDGKVIITGTLGNIYYYNKEKDYIESINYTSPILGLQYIVSPDELKVLEFQLKSDEILFFCTDGLLEIFLKNHKILDSKEFMRILKAFFRDNIIHNKRLVLNELPLFIKKFIPYFSFHDDVSAIVIQYKDTI
ncbi:MAG: hypothetical protein KatS3mg129_2501 [Leptospiraceae bacterium]|nr:MAG: hypothetical protein KatS3mg129_2501 [Leptospiraceae bacterium]